MNTDDQKPSLRVVLSLAMLAGICLVAELVFMRAFALVTWPPFAYLSVSVAMLGGGAAGALVTVQPRLAKLRATSTAATLLVGASIPLSIFLIFRIGLEPLLVGQDVGNTLAAVVVVLATALPFFGLGMVLSTLLSRHQAHASMLYGADLVGAAIGAMLFEPLLNSAGIGGAASLLALLAVLTTVLAAERPADRVASVLFGLVMVSFVDDVRHLLPRPTVDKKVGDHSAANVIEKLSDKGRLATFDRADARVDVIPAIPASRLLFDLGAAVTRAPTPDALEVRDDDVTSAAFLARGREGDRVLVLGSGAGYEVARALAFGAAHVDAVEIATGVIDAVNSGSIPSSTKTYTDARVTLHHVEARAFAERRARQNEKFDVVMAVHTITNAALASGAMQLVEDFLLTKESMTTLIRLLGDDGCLYITRPASQIPLLVATLREAMGDVLRDVAADDASQGINADDVDARLVVLESEALDPFFGGVMVFRGGAPSDLTLPRGVKRAPLPPTTTEGVPTDDRPFFHRFADKVTDDKDTRIRIEGPEFAERAVLSVAFIALLMALLVIVVPLLVRRRRRDAHIAPHIGQLVIASLLGFAFLLVELSFAQRLTLLTGTPLRAFAAVVGGMLIGAGGLLVVARHFKPKLPRALGFASLGAASMVFAPTVAFALAPNSDIGAVVLVVTLAALCALPLGLPFSSLIRGADAANAGWIYALNSVTGVLASAMFSIFAPRLGLAMTTAVGVALYLLAWGIAWRSDRPTSVP